MSIVESVAKGKSNTDSDASDTSQQPAISTHKPRLKCKHDNKVVGVEGFFL